MLKKIFLLVFILASGTTVHAQTADEVYNKYVDFNLAMLQNEHDKALTLANTYCPTLLSCLKKHAPIFIMV